MRLRPLLKYPGGKFYLARHILPIVLNHEVWVEAMCGGASLTLQKDSSSSQLEILNDINKSVYRCYEELLLNFFSLNQHINLLECSRDCFEELNKEFEEGSFDPADYIYLNRNSRNGQMKEFSTSRRNRGGRAENINSWETFKSMLPKIYERLKYCQIFNRDYMTLVSKYDGPKTCVYFDPPYLHSTRKSLDLYGKYEWTEQNHIDFLGFVRQMNGQAIISGYNSDLYNDVLQDWKKIEIGCASNMSAKKSKGKRVECVWSNRK